MKGNGKNRLLAGVVLVIGFICFTVLIQTVDVKPVGVDGTDVGFAALNGWFHRLTGVHMRIYHITDWMGLVPVFVCMFFGGVGLAQWLQRKNLFRVDFDILLLGGYYLIVILAYLCFEMMPLNYRPVFIEGRMEASYPSSTTLLVLCVMPTVIFQANRRMKHAVGKKIICLFSMMFSVFMVVGRMLSGVHWLTDIIGSVLLSAGLFCIYKAVVLLICGKRN